MILDDTKNTDVKGAAFIYMECRNLCPQHCEDHK
jgi:hypothetical protein